jgi:putative oxidoreductase
MLGRFVKLRFIPLSTDVELLFVRVVFAGCIFLKHGYRKVLHFHEMAQTFPDPIHIGPVASLVFATASDAICTLFIIAGLMTRLSSAYVAVIIFVAWSFHHHFMFFAHTADHGEICVLYIAAMTALVIGGPGRYSVDALLTKAEAAE